MEIGPQGPMIEGLGRGANVPRHQMAVGRAWGVGRVLQAL
jgi:hypothetical protein